MTILVQDAGSIGDLAARIEGRLAEAMRVVSAVHLDVGIGTRGSDELGAELE